MYWNKYPKVKQNTQERGTREYRNFTSRVKDGIKGSNKQARIYTSPAAVLITREQRG